MWIRGKPLDSRFDIKRRPQHAPARLHQDHREAKLLNQRCMSGSALLVKTCRPSIQSENTVLAEDRAVRGLMVQRRRCKSLGEGNRTFNTSVSTDLSLIGIEKLLCVCVWSKKIRRYTQLYAHRKGAKVLYDSNLQKYESVQITQLCDITASVLIPFKFVGLSVLRCDGKHAPSFSNNNG